MPVSTANALTPLEQQILHEALESCKRRFDQRAFFRRLSADELTSAELKYVFGQYGHFRVQLHRWFAGCIILIRDASEPAQRQAVLALADHIFTDLRDRHDLLFAELLHDLGFPVGTLHASFQSPATTSYIEAFLDDYRAPTATWVEAVAALSGRELSVVVRNQRLLRSHFAPRSLRAPTWLTLHADLEVEHFLDILRPVLSQLSANGAVPEAIGTAIDRGIRGHADFLDALLHEHESEAERCASIETRR
jgi:hypothetical protein